MKLATLPSFESSPNKRDGRLAVVSRDLAWYADAHHIVPTLQAALDNWERYEPELRALAEQLEHRSIPSERFHEVYAKAPLPRAYQWADGSAYVNHVELVRKARGAELPDSFWHDPLMYQGGSDNLLGARFPIVIRDEAWGCDMEAEICVVTDDVPMGVSPQAALSHIRLIGLVNDVSLRNLIPEELAKGFGFVQSKPASHFSPVFVTPDELGEAWQDGKVHLPLLVALNDAPFGCAEAGEECTFDFGVLIAHLAKTRKVMAGSIIGSGTVSNRDPDGSPGRPIAEGGRGYSCIAELRMVETIKGGAPVTPFLREGDKVRIEMKDRAGHSVFGAIEHEVMISRAPVQ